MFIKVSNIKKIDGSIDYKGIDISKIISGSQKYKKDLSFCILEISEIPLDLDEVEVLNQDEYLIISDEINNEIEKETLEIDNLKQAILDLTELVLGV